MGKEFSKELQENSEVIAKTGNQAVEKAGSPRELAKVHKKVITEYPYLKTVYEAMLVTDNRLPDNPIVFANDNFQKMTCYSREEIVGRNCRFLQGKYTDRETVRAIRKAVETGTELDVELLNYRKDGIPFWNNFLMLPVHKKLPKKCKPGEPNPVTHFIAIQKDVTVLKQGRNKPADWEPVEVAFYLDFLGLGQYGEAAVSNQVSGEVFLSLEDDDLITLGVHDQSHREAILQRIRQIQEYPGTVYNELRIGRLLRTGPVVSTSAEDDDTLYGDDVISLKSDSDSNEDLAPTPQVVYTSPPQDFQTNVENPRQLKYWSQQPTYDETICIKTYCGDDINISIIKSNASFKSLVKKIKSIYWAEVKLRFRDNDGDYVSITDDASFKLAKEQYRGRTVPIYVSKGEPVFPNGSKRKHATNSSTPVLLVSSRDNHVVWANQAALDLMKATEKALVENRDVDQFLPTIDLATWKGKSKATVRLLDNSTQEVTLSVSSRPNSLYQAFLRIHSK